MSKLKKVKVAAPASGRGGVRPGSGRKAKYGESTITIAFRVPASQAGVIRARCLAILEEYA